jgi:HEAT repeat protein
MLAHSFAMGVGTVFFETAASALFLARFPSSLLPWVYIAAAVVNTLTGVGYTALQRRVSFARLMVGTIALLLLAVVGARAGLWAMPAAAWLTFSLLVVYRVLSALTDLEYWAVAGRLYDVRQAKRLFGMIGSGEVVARILGSFSVPLLVTRIGVANLMLVSAAGLAACLVLLLAVLAGAGDALEVGAAKAESRHSAAGSLRQRLASLANPYLLTLLGVTVCAILGKYFVDFAFLEQMKSRYGGAQELASFFGLFSGATQVMSLLTRFFVSGPVLSRFGVRSGLLVLPLAHLACTALLVALSGVAAPAAVFWLVIANQGIYKVLKHPIDNPSFKVLYQPLKPAQRLAAQIAVETIVTPMTTGLAGLVMLLFTVVIPYQPARFAFVMLAAFGAWVAVALRAGRAYPAALAEALKGRIVDETFDFDDERSRAVLEQTLQSEHPAEVLFALDLLERLEHNRLGAVLVELLAHPAPEVRESALARLERLQLAGALPAVRARVAAEASIPVRAAALRCLCALGGPAVEQEVAVHLDDAEPQMRRAALIGLLRQEERPGESFASGYLRQLAGSHRPEKRVVAAQVVAEVGRSGLAVVLRTLLGDPVPSVRRAALTAAGKVGDAALWPLVASRLADPAFAGPAGRALVAGGEGALPAIEAAWEGATPQVRARAARVLGRIGGPRALGRLRHALGAADPRLRGEALAALRAGGWRPADEEREALEYRVRAEVRDAVWALATLRDLGPAAEWATLHQALDREFTAARGRVLQLLALLHDPTAMERARDHLNDPAKDKRAYALEILDVTLERELKQLVLPLCEELTPEQRCQRLEDTLPQPPVAAEVRLREALARPSLAPWTRACALQAAGNLRMAGVADAVAAAVAAEEPLLRETAAWAQSRLWPQPETEGRKTMLTIEKVITLKAVPMFARTSEELLADIAAILEEVEYKAGQVVFEKGQVGDSLYIVIEGRVRVYDEDHTITELGENEIFGELALLDPEPRVASIAAVEDTRLFRLDREAFSELMAGDIEIVRGVLAVLCERLRKTTY